MPDMRCYVMFLGLTGGDMVLHLTIKKEWFDKIASGEKKIEYREVKDYWIKRLCNNPGDETGEWTWDFKKFDEIYFKNGYSKNAPFMRVKHKYTVENSGMFSDLRIKGIVFAIHLGEILEVKRRPKNFI